MINRAQYSENELKMFKDLGFGYLIHEEHVDVEPYVFYRLASEHVFLNNLSGNHVEALRRGYNAFVKCSPYRLTKEYEELINYE
jgi:hypothetical protein